MSRLRNIAFTALAWPALVVIPACDSRRPSGPPTASLALIEVRHGRVVDVYGLRTADRADGVVLHARDVFVGYDLAAATSAAACASFGVDPDSLNPRLVIQHRRADPEFAAVLDGLIQATVPMTGSSAAQPAVVPRDAAFELAFSKDLPVDLAFFAELGDGKRMAGAKNLGAVWLQRAGAAAGNAAGTGSSAAEATWGNVVPARLLPRGDRLLVDPVLSTAEADAWQLPGSDGLPAPGAGVTANLELRLSLGQATSLPGLRPTSFLQDGQDLVVPFRTANEGDQGGHLASGFAAGGDPPRLLGALTMYLEAVDDVDPITQRVTLFKNGIVHDIDDGDVIRLFVDNSGVPVLVTDIVADPLDDRGQPAVGHVRALVTRTPGLRENDPRRLPGYPANPRSPEGERWLVVNAPRAVLMAEFIAERRAPSGQVYGDDPRYFVQWSPAPIENGYDPAADRVAQEPCDHVSPFAGAIVRFTRPVDPATVRPLDSLFAATRDLLGLASIVDFVRRRGIDPQVFDQHKHRTPHLVAATAIAVDSSNATFRLQPPLGFYLDAAMRQADEDMPFADKRYRYYLHLLGGRAGIRDRGGNGLDLQWTITPQDHVAIPFALDMRRDARGVALFPDNHAVSACRRFASRDEDEQPSYYLDDEVQRPNTPPNSHAYPLDDVFGAVLHVGDGRIQARPTSRVRKVADDLNQPPAPPQTSVLRWCPEAVFGEAQVATASAAVRFGTPIQNPSNPYGCRLQTLWREIDLGLSRVDPFDFNLDVEALYWGVHATSSFVADQFERTSLYLGHAEARPEPCVGAISALPTLESSGVGVPFADNYVHNRSRTGNKEDSPPPHAAFTDQPWTLDPARLVREPNNINRFAPAPAFAGPNFVWRDERVTAQGGNSQFGSDLRNSLRSFEPYIISPFLQGQGRLVDFSGGTFRFNLGAWSNAQNFLLGGQPQRVDLVTGGSVGSIGLPLLADVWVEPHEAAQGLPPPHGANGWQIALTVQSSSLPSFRAFSSGGLVNGVPRLVDPSQPQWQRASGGISANGQVTPPLDCSLYWAMVDFAKARTVMTAGFVELLDPHRMPGATVDPRLGPFFGRAFPAGRRVHYVPMFDPPLQHLPPGTSIAAEYRGAGEVDPQPWRAIEDRHRTVPDGRNFPLDPLKAGDAHIRKYDARLVGAQPRDWWTFPYNRNLTDYAADANRLSDPAFVARFAGPRDAFGPDEVRYLNWRLVMQNSVGAQPVAPALDSFMLAYRFEAR